ncbi:hypothetical protein [Patulibacter americanus]|uniref:hypothetical protein n=1 Tax=Patulibacter americanus TaxID=588672 RepID=UPI0003B7913E|nr:hypothetical protein [Patulibacter americanus]
MWTTRRAGGRRRADAAWALAAALAVTAPLVTGCGSGRDEPAGSPALREFRQQFAVLRAAPGQADEPPKGSDLAGTPELRRVGPRAVMGASLWLAFDAETSKLCPWLEEDPPGTLQRACLTPSETRDGSAGHATAGGHGQDRAVTYGIVRDGPRCAVLLRADRTRVEVPIVRNGWMTETRFSNALQSVAYRDAPCD